MGYYTSLRDYIETLESREKTISHPGAKCAARPSFEPLVRWQFRGLPESERRAFLFEKVASVARPKIRACRFFQAPAVLHARFTRLGMGCREEEIFDRWINAQKNPIDPIVVSKGPVQEIDIDSRSRTTPSTLSPCRWPIRASTARCV